VSRGRRIHDEERVKAKWRKRVRQRRDFSTDTGRPAGYTRPLPAKTVEAHAVRLAHHNCCDCWACKHPKGERLPKPAERRASGRREP
jgi:hypothetical protein